MAVSVQLLSDMDILVSGPTSFLSVLCCDASREASEGQQLLGQISGGAVP